VGKKYLVIGGHGFIGSHFCRRLNPIEYDVYDINQPNGSPSEWVTENRKKGINRSLSYDDIKKNQYGYLVHFGSLAGIRNGHDKNDFYQRNCVDYANLIKDVAFERLVYISSSSVLGDVESAYSISKKIAEDITRFSAPNRHAIIRPFTVYGDFGRPEMFINKCINDDHVRVNGNPENILRRFTYVEDLVDCILKYKDENKIVNAMGKTSYSLSDILDMFNVSFSKGPECPYDFKTQYLDDSDIFLCETGIHSVKDDLIKNNRKVS
jgi:nucleoside-diphosphate-sugar epimerase